MRLYFDQCANMAAGFTEPLHFHYETPLTHFRSRLGCLHEVYEVNYFVISWGSKVPMSDCSGCPGSNWFSDVSAPGV